MAGRPIEQLSEFLHEIMISLCLLSGENFSKIAQNTFEYQRKTNFTFLTWATTCGTIDILDLVHAKLLQLIRYQKPKINGYTH